MSDGWAYVLGFFVVLALLALAFTGSRDRLDRKAKEQLLDEWDEESRLRGEETT